eukprot:3377073-Pleurochrysis_carterae.AAC.4
MASIVMSSSETELALYASFLHGKVSMRPMPSLETGKNRFGSSPWTAQWEHSVLMSANAAETSCAGSGVVHSRRDFIMVQLHAYRRVRARASLRTNARASMNASTRPSFRLERQGRQPACSCACTRPLACTSSRPP